MRKQIATIFLVLFLGMIQIFPVYAQEDMLRVIDQADLLNMEQETELEAQLDKISLEKECDVVLLTVDTLEGKTATEYADDYYDQKGYGQGDDDSGILFLISMGEREWAISTAGYGITAFTDAGQEYMIEQLKSDLRDGNYEACFQNYARLCEEFLEQAYTDRPYDVTNLPREEAPGQLVRVSMALGIAVLISFFVMLQKKSEMKEIRAQKNAGNYVTDYEVTRSNDIFLYHTVSRQAQPKDTGSSTHTSSSGETHGGSSGNF